MARKCRKNRTIQRYVEGLDRAARLKEKVLNRLIREHKATAPKRRKLRVLHRGGCPSILTGREVDCCCLKEGDRRNV